MCFHSRFAVATLGWAFRDLINLSIIVPVAVSGLVRSPKVSPFFVLYATAKISPSAIDYLSESSPIVY